MCLSVCVLIYIFVCVSVHVCLYVCMHICESLQEHPCISVCVGEGFFLGPISETALIVHYYLSLCSSSLKTDFSLSLFVMRSPGTALNRDVCLRGTRAIS